jgi:putative membrane protein
MPSLFAFLHHVAAFAIVSALAVEFVLIRQELSVKNARALLFADLAAGASAGAVLVVGVLRVFFFEKGPAYYFHSIPFIAKLTLFGLIALLSIYPTIQFLSWRKDLKEGRAPAVSNGTLRRIRSVLHWELAAAALLILNATLMARGIGSFGG